MTGAVLRYLMFLPANLFFVALAWLLSPLLAAISVRAGVTVLPGFLQWFSTLDDTLDGGQHQHPDIYPPATGFKLWWQRVRWICRNPAHGWQARVLGFPTAGHTVISDNGRWTVMKDAKGRTYFSFRLYSPKVWIGWNKKAYDGVSHGYELQFNPFKKA